MFKEQCEKMQNMWRQLDDISEDLCEFANELDEFSYKIIKDVDEFMRYLTNNGCMNPHLKNTIELYLKYENK